MFQESEEGIIQKYDPNVKLLGAINREGVTCYLDALLFAMFARLGSYLTSPLYLCSMQLGATETFSRGSRAPPESIVLTWRNTTGSFEAILYDSFEDEKRKRLATLLRLWVNLLRAGKLITTDVVRTHLLEYHKTQHLTHST